LKSIRSRRGETGEVGSEKKHWVPTTEKTGGGGGAFWGKAKTQGRAVKVAESFIRGQHERKNYFAQKTGWRFKRVKKDQRTRHTRAGHYRLDDASRGNPAGKKSGKFAEREEKVLMARATSEHSETNRGGRQENY